MQSPLCDATVKPIEGSTLEISSTMIAYSSVEKPAPPYSSGNMMPRKPSSESSRIISKGKSCD